MPPHKLNIDHHRQAVSYYQPQPCLSNCFFDLSHILVCFFIESELCVQFVSNWGLQIITKTYKELLIWGRLL